MFERKYQFSYLTYNLLEEKINMLNLSQSEKEEIKKAHDNNLFNKNEIKDDIINAIPEMKKFFDYIDKNGIVEQIMLTSVGIVISIQYLEYITGEKFDYNLWI